MFKHCQILLSLYVYDYVNKFNFMCNLGRMHGCL